MRKLAALCLTAMLVSSPLAAAKQNEAPIILAERDRVATDGRAVFVDLLQPEIATDVDIGRVAFPSNGGGLLGALIISGQDGDAKRQLTKNAKDRAEAAVAPLRKALYGFDIAGLAGATSEAALAHIDWFDAKAFTLNPPDYGKRTGFLESATPQFAMVTYSYGLSPDFTQIRVIAEVVLAQKNGGKTVKGRAAYRVLARQRIASVAELRKRSYDASDNVTAWSAHDGALAKTSLTAAFNRLELLLPFGLGLTPAQIKALEAKGAAKAFAAGNYGAVVTLPQAAAGDTVIWDDQLIGVFPVGGRS